MSVLGVARASDASCMAVEMSEETGATWSGGGDFADNLLFLVAIEWFMG